jgi:hypothetical protein
MDFIQDYILDKSNGSWCNRLMDSNYSFFLGLAIAADTFASLRMSFLTEAISLRVGTFSNNFFRPSSNGASR